MWEALREAIDEEMEADPNVLVIGSFQKKNITPFLIFNNIVI